MKQNNKKKQIISYIIAALVLIANLSILALIAMAWIYSGIDETAFYSIVGALICAILILDVVFVVSYLSCSMRMKMATFLLAVILLGGSLYANYLLVRVNNALSGMINSDSDQYETISVSVVTYNNETISSIEDLEGLTVGLTSTTNDASPSAVGKSKLEEAGISVEYVEYESVDALMSGLIAGEIDCALLPSSYASMYEDQDGYEEYLDAMTVIEQWSEDVLVGQNTSSDIDLSMDPFTVLLIGYAPESDTYGLADTIMLATVNPRTLTVTLTSIPRDSYVQISGTSSSQKINSARAISRQTLIDTVSELMDIEIDFYMEVNFKGVVAIVDALGGIEINSTAAFLAQNSDTERGNYTIWIEEGVQWADGEMALAFARERYAFASGDYDRQLNQQQVITSIVSRLLELNDINVLVDVIEAAGDNLSTNLSVEQLTSLFSYALSISNYTGLDTMDLIDIQNMRVTGYSSYYYDYGSGLSLWIMIPYEGSIAQNYERIQDTLGNVEHEQISSFTFSAQDPYERGQLYDEYFDEVRNDPEIPEQVPDFVDDGYTLSEITAWCSENDIELEIVYIDESDSRYDAALDGQVVDQSVSSGTLVSRITSITIYIAESSQIPNFVGSTLSTAQSWANRHGIELSISYIESSDASYDSSLAGTIASQSPTSGDIADYSYIEIVVYAESETVTAYDAIGLSYSAAVSWCSTNGYTCSFLNSNRETVSSGTVSELWGYYDDGTLWFIME